MALEIKVQTRASVAFSGANWLILFYICMHAAYGHSLVCILAFYWSLIEVWFMAFEEKKQTSDLSKVSLVFIDQFCSKQGKGLILERIS